MSVIAYAQITQHSEDTPILEGVPDSQKKPETRQRTLKSYSHALAAMVPAEILAIHALLMSWVTKPIPPVKDKAATQGVEASTTEAGTNAAQESAVFIENTVLAEQGFWVLVALCFVLFAVTKLTTGKWTHWDYGRMLVPPAAFVGWTMLEQLSAFDAAFPQIDQPTQWFYAVVLAVTLTALSLLLAKKAAEHKPTL
ncbi:MAG: hypothetical protein AAGD01_05445 [Acidobacteriota bacterium]